MRELGLDEKRLLGPFRLQCYPRRNRFSIVHEKLNAICVESIGKNQPLPRYRGKGLAKAKSCEPMKKTYALDFS
jgi:hypothetical protein